MILDEFLQKWGIKKSTLAKKVGLTSSGLYNKLSEKNPDKLTTEQREDLSKLIKEEMYKDIESLEI